MALVCKIHTSIIINYCEDCEDFCCKLCLYKHKSNNCSVKDFTGDSFAEYTEQIGNFIKLE